MNFEKIKNQIMELNIKEENMSFNEYKETIKSYALEKGMEYLENNRKVQCLHTHISNFLCFSK